MEGLKANAGGNGDRSELGEWKDRLAPMLYQRGGDVRMEMNGALFLPIDSIQIGERHRKDIADLSELKQSIEANGLLHPIVVSPENKLISGLRRLKAYKELGHREIPVTIMEPENHPSSPQLAIQNEVENGETPDEEENQEDA